MAIITRIRKLSGFAVGLVFVALALFIVGGDLLSPNSSLLQAFNKQVAAEIDGNSISLQEFSQQYEQTKSLIETIQLGRPLNGDQELEFARYNAFNDLVYKLSLEPDYEKLGLKVTPEELTDMIQGNNIEPSFAQQFTNPQTGQLDRNMIIQFLQSPQQQGLVRALEFSFAQNRLRKKHAHLLAYSTYATTQEAKQYHKDQNSKRQLSMLYVPFSSISDSTIKVDNALLATFLSQNKAKYKRKENRAIEYVVFPFRASSADSADIRNNLANLKNDFAKATDAKAFADGNSETNITTNTYKPGDLPEVLNPDSLRTGQVYGPYQMGGAYALYRVIDTNDDSLFSAKASHILFNTRDLPDSAKAKKRADAERVLRQVMQNPADFGMLASTYSEDNSNKYKGGDLGWFPEKQMVPPFESAVMSATKEGVIPRLVETDYGYHIINVTGVKSKRRFNLAIITKEIAPSDATRSAAYTAAGAFAEAKNAKEYADKVQAAKTIVSLQALTIPADAKNINNLTGSKIREVVRWAYTEAKLGDVSRVFELDDQYMVALLRDATEEGDPTVEDVKDQLTTDYRNAEKAKLIIAKLAKLTGPLAQMKDQYGKGAEFADQIDLNIYSSNIRMSGYAPTAVGYAMALEKGQRTKPFKDETGVFVLEGTGSDDASEVADYNAYKKQIATSRKGQIDNNILEAMKKIAKVKNFLARYY
ncbi:MAG: peptidylprolyl isomerase [Bernardetiaceae bacterium]|nr:peptidylprolyl isomerase [Bernardetiaceae bacterium]